MLAHLLAVIILCVKASPGQSPRRGLSESFGSGVHSSDFEVSTTTDSPSKVVYASSSSSNDEDLSSEDDFVSRRPRRVPSSSSILTREAMMREMSRIAGNRYGVNEMIQEGSGKDPHEEYLHRSDFETSSPEEIKFTSNNLDSGETTEEDDSFSDEVWTVEPSECDRCATDGYNRRRESIEAILRDSLRNNRKARMLQRSQNTRKRKETCQHLCIQSDPPSISVNTLETKEGSSRFELNSRLFSSLNLDAEEAESLTDPSKTRLPKSTDGSTAQESATSPETDTAPSSMTLSPESTNRLANMLAEPSPRWRKVSPGYKPTVSVSRTPSPRRIQQIKDAELNEDLS